MVQVHLGPRPSIALPARVIGDTVKKLLVLAALAGIAFVVYRQVAASKAEQDLWTEATAAPDLR